MSRLLRKNGGFALVLTLVVTVLMVAATVELIHQVYVDTAMSRGFRDGQQASLLAESGITGAGRLLRMVLDGQQYSSFSDKWAEPLRLDDETGTVEITTSEESGLISMNSLVQPNGELEPFTLAMLRRLGKRARLADDAWNGLADWLDSDDLPRTNGAESAYYRSLKTPYEARNTRLTTVTELTMVRGFTPEAVAALRPFVTVYAGQPGAPLAQVNINTAPRKVLMALDDRIDDRMAERIMEERRLKPFKSTAELSRVPGLESVAIGLLGKISVKGTVFRIRSLARVKESARTVEAVLRLAGGAPEVLYWREY